MDFVQRWGEKIIKKAIMATTLKFYLNVTASQRILYWDGITVDNTELTKESIVDKGVLLDLRVTLGDGSIINVEMQIDNEYNMAKRSVHNLSRIMTGQVKVSEYYAAVNRVRGTTSVNTSPPYCLYAESRS